MKNDRGVANDEIPTRYLAEMGNKEPNNVAQAMNEMSDQMRAALLWVLSAMVATEASTVKKRHLQNDAEAI